MLIYYLLLGADTCCMKKLPFDLTDIGAEDVQALENAYRALRLKFKIGLAADHTFDRSKFDVFNRDYIHSSLGGSILINHPENGCYLSFIKVRTAQTDSSSPVSNNYSYQVWGSATLRNDFGRITIKRETIKDKMLSAASAAEMHFKDDRPFNKKFCVMADNPEKAAHAMTKAFRNALMEIRGHDFTIEIVNSTLVIGSGMPVDPRQIVYLAEVASKLSSVK